MEDEDARTLRFARPTAEDIPSGLTAQQLDGIRRRVRACIDSIEAGENRGYEGARRIKKLADEVKARGRSARWKSSASDSVSCLHGPQPDLDQISLDSGTRRGTEILHIFPGARCQKRAFKKAAKHR